MNYYPNTDGALHLIKSIMPHIWQKDPAVSLCIAGLNPPQVIRDLTTDPRIEVIANFEDMREVAQRCCLTLVPLRLGGGTRIKILDSFALGLPVISTSLGCEGLPVVEGKHILIRDDPKQFANAVLEVISNPIMANNLRTNGRRLVEERYDWEKTFEQLEREMLSLVVSKAH
jgi:glycosyltransferase involved in cell wall biosynthesis